MSTRERCAWLRMIRSLRKNFCPGVPVRVQTARGMKDDGDCDGIMQLGRMTSIVIRISSRLTWGERVDALRHEWAHAMEWSAHWKEGSPKKVHGETWGVWYAKIYTLLDDEWEGIIHELPADL